MAFCLALAALSRSSASLTTSCKEEGGEGGRGRGKGRRKGGGTMRAEQLDQVTTCPLQCTTPEVH